MWTDAEIHQRLSTIAAQYEIFQCQECAEAMKRWLVAQKIEGVLIRLRAYDGNFIISERTGGDVAISQNGFHYGVEVRGKIFDNLPMTGLAKQVWLNDFDCIGGFEVIETQFS